MRISLTLILLIFVFLQSLSHSQVLDSEAEAFRLARETGRPVFLVFAGSDWCVPCIRFEKEVLTDSLFLSFAEKKLALLRAEFPQKKKLSPELIAQNDKLAERYNPQGLFPHLVLLDPGGTLIQEVEYRKQTAEEFISEMMRLLPGTPSLGEGLHPSTRDSILQQEIESLREYTTKALLMGTVFEFTLVIPEDPDRGWALIQECIDEVKRIESLISEWSDTTQIGRLNMNSGIESVRVSPEVYELIRRCIAVSDLTQGAFDITFGGAGKLWGFDPEHPVIPDSSDVENALNLVGYQNIQLLENDEVLLKYPGMQVGFGGIGKGYAAERVRELMQDRGVTSGVINASGDLTAWGMDADGNPWKVGIADPEDPSKVLLWLPVKDAAVATSGNYEKYVMINGERYGHILDPRTGYPVRGIKSVTVISPDAELSDALATAVFVMGVEAGLDFIQQLPDTHCIIVDDENTVHYSKDVEFFKGDDQ